MPELPEVETVRRGLASHMEGRRITSIEVRNAKLREPVPATLADTIAERTVREVARRAKYLLIHMSGGKTLIVHLGMSGSMVVHKQPPRTLQKHDHVIFRLSDGSVIVFRDPRRFGLVLCCDTAKLEQHKLFSHLGPEPLDNQWNANLLYDALQARKAPVKSAIMDQQVVVGVGNIYACEALFASGIHPARISAAVTQAEAKKLTANIRKVLKAATRSGGSTLRDYVRSSGDSGYFQHQFQVYGKNKEPCPNCNTPIAVMRQSGRSSFFCPACQK